MSQTCEEAKKFTEKWKLRQPPPGPDGNKSDKSDLSDTDIDIMLYILGLPDLSEIDCALHEIPAAASKYRFAQGLPRDEVIREIHGMILSGISAVGDASPKNGGRRGLF